MTAPFTGLSSSRAIASVTGTSYTYDDGGAVETITQGGLQVVATRDDLGRPTSVTLPRLSWWRTPSHALAPPMPPPMMR